ncbi:MAG: hypothetical protein U0166_09400 [Acidobacteriota bacterium]
MRPAARIAIGIVACLDPARSPLALGGTPDAVDLGVVLDRTGKQVAGFLDQLSDVQCVEEVRQEKLGPDQSVKEELASRYHYLVLLGDSGGDLTVDESRHPVAEAATHADTPSMLVSNGFAMLFLIFHPAYASSFQFSATGREVVGGRSLEKIAFHHLRGTRSPAALTLRGREYPLDLSGTAWIDVRTGVIARILASVEDSMTDVGLDVLRADEQFAPVFPDVAERHWFPSVASIEVATPRQHWRNTHRFTDYRRFSVSTDERISASAEPEPTR